MTGSLTDEEFQLLQQQLIQLKSSNYELEEKCKKQHKEIVLLESRNRSLEDELQKSAVPTNAGKALQSLLRGKIPLKTAGSIDVQVEAEIEKLRKKFGENEAEFRLQNQTLIEECQRLTAINEDLQLKLQLCCESPSFSKHEPVLLQCCAMQTEPCETTGACAEHTVLIPVDEKNIPQSCKSIHAEFSLGEDVVLKTELENCKQQLEDAKQQKIEVEIQLEMTTNRLSALQDELQQVEAGFSAHSNDKKKQFSDLQSKLQEVLSAKGAEVTELQAELSALRQNSEQQLSELKLKADDNLALWRTERVSLDSRVQELEKQVSQHADQMEASHILARETMCANDCLSAQLQEARADVARFQSIAENAEKAAEKRKKLMDEMAAHLEQVKAEHRAELCALEESLNSRIAQLTHECELERDRASQMEDLPKVVENLRSELNSVLERKEELKQRVTDLETQLQLSSVQHDEMFQNFQTETLERHSAEVDALTALTTELQQKLSASEELNLQHQLREEKLKQEILDLVHDVRVTEKKHSAVLKDLKRQVQAEKKRADRLQERLQEARPSGSGEHSRSKSPDYQLKVSETGEKFLKVNGDNSSVSSWSVVSAKDNKDSSERRSNHTENDMESVTSEGTLEQENESLISRLAELQRVKWEQEEKIQLLESAKAALTDTVADKTVIIEQMIREKSVSAGTSSSSSSGGSHALTSTIKENLPPGLKKMIEFVKIDQSAVDIREMNRRLQIMLEETLTKNMHLTKDLETMSQEVQRLSAINSKTESQLS